MEGFYKEVLENLDEGVYFVDRDRKITFWNKAAEIITGFKSDEVLNTHCYDNLLQHVDDFGNKLCLDGCPLVDSINDGIKREVKVYLHHKEGHRVKVYVKTIPLENESGKNIGAIEIFSRKKEMKLVNKSVKKLEKLAYTDQLTNIYNRQYMAEYMDLKFKEFEKFDENFSVIFLDIDHFKNVNDTYGHDIGDEVLKLVANTLKYSVRKEDLVVRYGGEEFIVICNNLNEIYLNEIAETIRILIENSVLKKEDYTLSVTVSIGGTIVSDKDDKKSIIKRADELMYESKQNGRNRVTIG